MPKQRLPGLKPHGAHEHDQPHDASRDGGHEHHEYDSPAEHGAGAHGPASPSRVHPEHSNHRHDHGAHDHIDPASSGRLLGVAFALTAGFMGVEVLGAAFADSLALLADAGHMLTDAAALAFAWAATRIAARPADARRSFGYQRLRVLATFINGCALLCIVAWIAFKAAQRLLQPAPVDGNVILWIGIGGLLVNLVVFVMLRRNAAHDMNVSAAALHVMGDLLGSVAAVVAGAVILRTGWAPIDPLLSLLVSALIVHSAWTLVRQSAHILMEGAPDWLDLRELRSTLEQHVPAIREVHHVHCWQVGPHETLLTMHAAVDSGVDHSAVLRQANTVLAEKFGITHATIQIEDQECVGADCGPAVQQATHSHAAAR